MRATLLMLITGAAAASAVLLGPAGPAAAAESAVATIGLLEAQGFDVKIDRIGTAPLSQCVVTDVRNPRERKEFVRFDRRDGRDRFAEVVVRRTITVSLDCSR